VSLHLCLAFPDVYEVGMSHLGLQILYDLANRHPAIWAERAFLPWPDMESLLREKKVPLFSLESKRALNSFDVLGFSVQYELCATGVLTMLDLGGIPLRAVNRDETCPVVIAGGPLALHPEPLADFFDVLLLGDAEEMLPEFLELMLDAKERRLSRRDLLEKFTQIEGAYVPCLPAAAPVRRRILPSLTKAPYPLKPLVPAIKIVHDRLGVELMRGCLHGCRFCQAGYIYRPQRERDPNEVLSIVQNSLAASGFEELSFLSLSSTDYHCLLPLLSRLSADLGERQDIGISLPSSRVNLLSLKLLSQLKQIHRAGFTIAPEAGTQRLRDVINKGITDEELLETCRNVFALGWESIKLYFMIGLPTETDQDLEGIVSLAKSVKQIAGRHNTVTVSVSTFVPKPFTPFQWAEQISLEETERRQRLLTAELRRTGISLRYHQAFSSILEGIISRGDRKVSLLLERAYQLGCRMDGWSDKLRQDLWERAMVDSGIEPQHYLRTRQPDESLPWDHIDCGIPKKWLNREREKALLERLTPNCLTRSCSACGVCTEPLKNVFYEPSRTLDQAALSPTIDELTGSTPYEKSGQVALQRLRLTYTKHAALRFVSHLDFMALLTRAVRRAKLPLAVSGGYSPKPRISFGPPLQLGIESDCELADFFLSAPISAKDCAESLNACLPDGVRIVEASEIALKAPSIQEIIRLTTYELSLFDGHIHAAADFPHEAGRELLVTHHKHQQTEQVPLAACTTRLESIQCGYIFSISHDRGATAAKPLEIAQALCGSAGKWRSIRKIAYETIAAAESNEALPLRTDSVRA